MTEIRTHAVLSASSAHRWLACPPSARLEETFPDTESPYAAEGTLAHAICELKLKQKFIKQQAAATYKKKLKKLQTDELYQSEMEMYTEEYIDYISEIVYGFDSTPYVAAEVRVDFSHVVPEGFGTCDCIIIHGNQMHIVDFKYGKNVHVSAGGNPQLKLYALGALKAYGMLYPIERITLHIVQPRVDNNNSVDITVEELNQWASVIKPWVEQAYKGEGDFSPGEETCRFCRAKATCRARAEKNLELAKDDFKLPPLLTNDEAGEALKKAMDIKQWVTDLEAWALKAILSGEEVAGWKAVEGRSNRTFADQDKAFEIIKASGVDENMLYERKPITLTAVEKLLGKKEFTELLADQIVKPPGKPTLAPETDKRKAITLKTTAEEDFKEEK